MSVLERALAHYRQQRAVAVAAVRAARRQVREHPQDAVGLARMISGYQIISATVSSRTMATEASRSPYVDPLAFAGRTAGGIVLTGPTQTLLDDLTVQMEAAAGALTDDMLARIDRMVASEVTEAGRGAAGVEIAAEPMWTNYVRVLQLTSCPRCVILAGRIYRDNEGFARHPLCDCEHWPVESWEQAHDEGLVFSAQAAFDAGQIRGLSRADTKAILDGADINQVVNAHSGMYTSSIYGRDGIKGTSAGTTKRSAWRKANPNRRVRLRPESIYELAKDRDDEIRLLKLYGYINADADIPTGNDRPGGAGRGGSGRSGAPPAGPGGTNPPSGGDGLNEAADRVMSAAVSAEPSSTPHVRSAVLGRGDLERLDSRFKSRTSVIEKLTKFGSTPKAIARQERRFNDALRYTVVIPDASYWASAADLSRLLGRDGYSVRQEPLQWAAAGYKGINLKVTGPDGTVFEVQLHTRASLDAAESTHRLYEDQRKLQQGSAQFAELGDEMDRIFAAVPFPPGRPA